MKTRLVLESFIIAALALSLAALASPVVLADSASPANLAHPLTPAHASAAAVLAPRVSANPEPNAPPVAILADIAQASLDGNSGPLRPDVSASNPAMNPLADPPSRWADRQSDAPAPVRAPAGTGTITGTVWYSTSGGLLPAGFVTVWVYPYPYDASGIFTVTTNASGVYIAVVNEGSWSLAAFSNGYTLQQAPLVTVGTGQTVSAVDLVWLPQTATVTGHVRDQNNAPVFDASVFVRDAVTGNRLQAVVKTDVTGAYTMPLAAGTWRQHASRSGYLSFPDTLISVAASGSLVRDLTLQGLYARIIGTVREQGTNTPLANALVDVSSKQSPAAGNPPDTLSDASGVYTLSVYAGSWNLNAIKTGWTSNSDLTRDVTDTQVLTGVDIFLPKADSAFQGTVTISGGIPVNGAFVDAVKQLPAVFESAKTNADASGTYSLPVSNGTWVLGYVRAGYTAQQNPRVSVDPGTVVTQNLVLLTNTATLSGILRDQYGQPVPNSRINIIDAVNGRNVVPSSTGQVDASGQYTIGVAGGAWKVSMSRSGYASCTRNFNIADGQTLDLDLRMTLLDAMITGTVRDDYGVVITEPLSLSANQQWGCLTNAGASDGSGHFAIAVSRGVWNIGSSTNLTGFVRAAEQSVLVQAGQTLPDYDLIYPRSDNTVTGTVRDSVAAPVAGALVNASFSSGNWTYRASANADSSGAYTLSLSGGTWRLSVPTYPTLPVSSRLQALVLLHNQTVGNVDFTFGDPSASIRGTVLGSGTGISGTAVFATRMDGTPAYSATTDASGAYTLAVSGGDWQLSPNDWPAYLTPPSRVFHVDAGQTLLGANLSYISGTATVRGQIRLADGTPLAGWRVDGATNLSNGPSVPRVTADANGFYTLPLAAGHWRVSPSDNVAFGSQPTRPGVYLSDGQTIQIDHVYVDNNAYLRGQVRDAIGQPRTGVYVRASRVGTGEAVSSQSTDANGMYTLSVSSGDWSVGPNTVLPGFTRPPNQTARAIANQTTQNLDFVYQANSTSLSGHVLLAGAPLSGTLVFASSPIYGGFNLVTSDNSGAYHLDLPPGVWTLQANNTFVGYVVPPPQTLASTGAAANLDFNFAPSDRVIKGVVRAGGLPLAGIYVNASRSDGAQTGSSTTDASGVYTLPINAGFWTVSVNTDLNGYARPPSLDVDAIDDAVLNADMNYLTADARVSGQFRAESGAPIVGAGARSVWDYGSTAPGVPTVWTDLNGMYTLTVSPGAWQAGQNVALGGLSTPLRVGVSLAGGQLLAGTDQVYATNASAIMGTIRDAAGNPIGGVTLSASERRSGRSAPSVVTDSQGRYRLTVSDGIWSVGTTTAIPTHSAPPFRSVEVAGGATVANIDFTYQAANAVLAGTIRDSASTPLPFVVMNATNQSGWRAPAITTDASGQYRIAVAPGTWTLQPVTPLGGLVAPGSRATAVTAPLTYTTDFTYTISNASITGTITTDGSTPLPGLRMFANLADPASGATTAFAPIASTDSAGNYRLRATGGAWSLGSDAQLPGWLTPNCCAPFPTNGSATTLNLIYSAALKTISGRVTVGGAPVRGAQVNLTRMDVGLVPGVPWVYTDGDGHYTAAVAPGQYTVAASAAGYIRSPATNVTVGGASPTGVDLALDSPSGYLSGLVRDANARPLQGVTIRVMDKDFSQIALNRNGAAAATASTNNAGEYFLPLGLAAEPYVVLGTRRGYAQNSIPLNFVLGDNPIVDLTLDAQAFGTVQGRLASNTSTAVDRSVLWLRQPGTTRSAGPQTGTSYNWIVDAGVGGGDFVTMDLAPGDYLLHAAARGYQSTDVTVTVAAGSIVSAQLVLTPTSVPNFGVSYNYVNMPLTMTAGSPYYASLSQMNVGSMTWQAGGGNPVTLGYRWFNASGSVIFTEMAAAILPSDVVPDRIISSRVVVTAPAAAGVYTLTWDLVRGGNWFGNSGADTQSLVVTVPGAAPLPDLAVQPGDLWLEPPLFQTGSPQTATVGMNVYNIGAGPATAVPVCFYDGVVGGTPIGTCPILTPFIPAGSWQVITAPWSTSFTGTHVVVGVVDPFNTLSETLKSNNVVSLTFTVEAAAADKIPPQGTLNINGGALATASPAVTLNLSASDSGGSGLFWMQIVELAFDAVNNRWTAVQNSGWINYRASLPWTLGGTSGDRALRVWFADGAHNVSQPASTAINLTPACSAVAGSQWKPFGAYLTAGTVVTLSLTTCAGDADLFVWLPNSQGEPDFYSTNADLAPDVVTFVTTHSGFHRFYAYGALPGSYSLALTGAAATVVGGKPQSGTRILIGGKSLPALPPVPGEEPPPFMPVGVPPPINKMYLPLIKR